MEYREYRANGAELTLVPLEKVCDYALHSVFPERVHLLLWFAASASYPENVTYEPAALTLHTLGGVRKMTSPLALRGL